MASDLKSTEGAAILQIELKARSSLWASGRLSQVVPICFQIKATASMRKKSTPMLARKSISAAMAQKTAGLE